MNGLKVGFEPMTSRLGSHCAQRQILSIMCEKKSWVTYKNEDFPKSFKTNNKVSCSVSLVFFVIMVNF